MKEESTYQQAQKELHKKMAFHYEERYCHDFSRTFHEFWNSELLSLSPPASDMPVLDFGCGTGILCHKLSGKYPSVTGLDLSYDMLIKAPKNINAIKGYIVADGGCLPFHDNTFNLVICRGSLHHLPDLDETLIAIRRILRKDGIFLFSEPSNDNYLIRFSRLLMYKLSSRFDERDTAFVTSDLVYKLKKAGFKIEVIKRFGFFSYVFSAVPDHFSLMIYVPFNVQITRFFIWIDRQLARIPVIKDQSFQIIMKVKKS